MTDLPHILPAITSIGQHLPEHNHKPTVITNQPINKDILHVMPSPEPNWDFLGKLRGPGECVLSCLHG